MNKLFNKKDVVIFGAGGHAHVIADIVVAKGDNVVAFLDDDSRVESAGCINDYIKYNNAEFIIGIGDSYIREKIAKQLYGKVKWYTATHPSAVISPSAVIGFGTVIMPNTVVNARTVIGNHCIINSGAVVEHDNQISNYSHISVGAKLGGTVFVGEKTWIGIGTTVINNISICENCIIGAGATVIRDIKDKGTYVGNPVRKIK